MPLRVVTYIMILHNQNNKNKKTKTKTKKNKNKNQKTKLLDYAQLRNQIQISETKMKQMSTLNLIFAPYDSKKRKTIIVDCKTKA